MIYSTITQKGLSLNADSTEIPLQYSNDIKFKFIKDEKFSNYVIVPYVGVADTKLLECNDKIHNLHALEIDENGIFKISNKIMFKEGYLFVAFDLTNSEETIHIGNVVYVIKPSVGGVSVLPETSDEWQAVVRAFMQQYTELNIKPQIDELIEEAQEQQIKAQQQQAKAQELQTEAETQQTIAETQQSEATRLQSIASEQQAIAETMQSEVLEQQEITSELQTKTQEQQVEATRLQNVAKEQQALANTLQVTAKEQQDIASEQQTKAETQQAEVTKLQATAKEQQDIASNQQVLAKEQQTKVSELQTTALAQQTEVTRLQGVAADQQQAVNSLKSEAQEQQTKAQQQQAKAQELQTEAETQQTIAETQQKEATRLQKATDDAIDEMKRRISELASFTISIVDVLPAIGTPNVIYLVHKEGTTDDVYDEYLWIDANQSYEPLGSTEVDVSNCLALTGGTMSGDLKLNNGVFITTKFRFDQENVVDVIGCSANDQLLIGDKKYPMYLRGSDARVKYNLDDIAFYRDVTTLRTELETNINTKLSLQGGTALGNIILANGIPLQGLLTDNTTVRNLIYLTSSNDINVGQGPSKLRLNGGEERPNYNGGYLALFTDTTDKLPLTGGDISDNITFLQGKGIKYKKNDSELIDMVISSPFEPYIYFGDKRFGVKVYGNQKNIDYMYHNGTQYEVKKLANLSDLDDCVKRTDFAKVDGKIALTNGAGTVQLQYPSGFTKTNSVILTIAKEFANNSGNWDYISQQGTMLFGARLLDNSINVTISSVGGGGSTGTYGIRVVLAKI